MPSSQSETRSGPLARKMAEGYTGGLHRVIFYCRYSNAIERMGRLMGFKTIQEC